MVRERELKNIKREVLRNNNVIPTLAPEFAKRKAYRNCSLYPEIWKILDNVFDPELPGLTIWDLGILQDVQQVGAQQFDPQWEIFITPTYSGCPAVDTISQNIKTELASANYNNVKVNVVLSPAWSTEMMSPKGKMHLKSINIAPPDKNEDIFCPICHSKNTKLISQFGSTACKSFYQCNDCSEGFDYFKYF